MGEKKAYEEIETARTHTNWPGRMQWIDFGVPILLDCAHNPSGMARACEQIRFQKSRDMAPMPGVVVVGTTTQKDLDNFLQPLVELIVEGGIRHVYVTQPPKGRKEPVNCEHLAEELHSHGTDAEITAISSIEEALSAAQFHAKNLDSDLSQPVLCIGSIYLIGAILEIIDEDGKMDLQNILITPSGEDGIDPIA